MKAFPTSKSILAGTLEALNTLRFPALHTCGPVIAGLGEAGVQAVLTQVAMETRQTGADERRLSTGGALGSIETRTRVTGCCGGVTLGPCGNKHIQINCRNDST